MQVNATLEKREKKDKTGFYYCIVIPITKDYSKVVFLTKLEEASIKNTYKITDQLFYIENIAIIIIARKGRHTKDYGEYWFGSFSYYIHSNYDLDDFTC